MKENFEYITNYKQATVLDLEADGLLDTITKIHIVGYQLHNQDSPRYLWGDTERDRIKAMVDYHRENQIPMVFHNGYSYDRRAIEKVLGVSMEGVQLIDTLWLSYYLNLTQKQHSIAELSKFYDAGEKFEVANEDWATLTKEQAISRVVSDVQIGKVIYDDFIERLEEIYALAKTEIDLGNVGGKRQTKDEKLFIDNLKNKPLEWHVGRIIGYLCSIADVVALQEETGWYVDLPYLTEHLEALEELSASSKEKLESVMPKVPKYIKRSPPKKPFKKNGELSATGERWEKLKKSLQNRELNEYGHLVAEVREVEYIHELTSMEKPNANSHDQVKDFLFSKGWKPKTFKSVRDKEAFTGWLNKRPSEGSPRREWNSWRDSRPVDRQIPQVKDGDELCESVSELAKEFPEVAVLEEYSVINHRIGVLKSIRDSIRGGGCVEASAHGLANTLRLQHRKPVVNLPSNNGLHAQGIRGSLVAREGMCLIGSDLGGLEDVIKTHLMYPHDKNLAEEMSKPDFDAHLEQAISMGLITREQSEGYKKDTLSSSERAEVRSAREAAKPVNYLSAYNGTYKALMIQTGWGEQRCKDAIDAYWEVNWSLRAVAEEQVTIKNSKDEEWLIHPTVGILLNLRSDKDRFNLVCQGGGSFMHFNWLFGVLNRQKGLWGRRTLTGNVHDELILSCRDEPKWIEIFTKIIKESVKEVSDKYGLRRELGCDVGVGHRYSEIH